jgi:starch-binding outer membrane protein, SusD/RagB family
MKRACIHNGNNLPKEGPLAENAPGNKLFHKMKKGFNLLIVFFSVLFLAGNLTSCEKFFEPDQEVTLTEEQMYSDWYEYRAAVMGLYGLQQELVEQLLVLGELRADLLEITPNADADLVEVYNLNISKDNKYASPQNFFKLIAATNRFISTLEKTYPDVLNPATPVNNYDRVYGEALCMRAWAYFNAVRIYGKVPFIDQRIGTIEEINQFINSPGTYIDSVYVVYGIDGYNNDTIFNKEIVLEKNYFDTDRVIRHFTNELETKVKAVGVNHYIENNDNTWEVTIWSTWSYNTLLGHMYLTLGDLAKGAHYFEQVIYNNTINRRYQIDNAFANSQWGNIFFNVDSREHIYTIWFNKASQQQNDFQLMFEPWSANQFMLKPTRQAVHKWETQWRGAVVRYDYVIKDSTKTMFPGQPADYYRGYGVSYLYTRGTNFLMGNDYLKMLEYKRLEEERSVESIMENMDTIVVKYSLSGSSYDRDANYIIYRAGGVNLYLAEIYNHWVYEDANGNPSRYVQNALNIINNGSNYDMSVSRVQMGIRGRVGLGSGEAAFKITDITFSFDPFTNKVTGWRDLTGNLQAKQYLLEENIMEERARELAFEGERFYDLMRVAQRRGDPSYLAKIVSEKFSGGKRQVIYNQLLNPDNWYINYFE